MLELAFQDRMSKVRTVSPQTGSCDPSSKTPTCFYGHNALSKRFVDETVYAVKEGSRARFSTANLCIYIVVTPPDHVVTIYF